MLNIISLQGNANGNHNAIALQTHEDSWNLKDELEQALVRTWRNRNPPHKLLVRI